MEIEKLKNILKQLEGVYKVTTNPAQKSRVKEDIEKIKNQIDNILKYGEEEILTDTENEVEEKDVIVEEKESTEKLIEHSQSLSKFKTRLVHPLIKNNEINLAISYIEIFEDELWGMLSDFHLKLDFYHSREREKFYNKLENLKRIIKQYIDVLNELSNIANDHYADKLKSMKNKQERAILIEAVKFMNEMNIFLDKILKDHDNDGNILLNPTDKINFSSIEGIKYLNNKEVLESLRFINTYCVEFVEIIQLPEEMLNLKNTEY